MRQNTDLTDLEIIALHKKGYEFLQYVVFDDNIDYQNIKDNSELLNLHVITIKNAMFTDEVSDVAVKHTWNHGYWIAYKNKDAEFKFKMTNATFKETKRYELQ